MEIFNGLLIASFLILLAASVAVVTSMIVLALFDLAFAKKRTPPAQDTDMTEGFELNEPLSNPKTEDEALTRVVPFKRSA